MGTAAILSPARPPQKTLRGENEAFYQELVPEAVPPRRAGQTSSGSSSVLFVVYRVLVTSLRNDLTRRFLGGDLGGMSRAKKAVKAEKERRCAWSNLEPRKNQRKTKKKEQNYYEDVTNERGSFGLSTVDKKFTGKRPFVGGICNTWGGQKNITKSDPLTERTHALILSDD